MLSRPDISTSTGDTESEQVLVHAPTGRDNELISQVLKKAGFDVRAGESLTGIDVAEVGVMLVAEEALVGDALNELWSFLSTQPAWSDLPVIILTAGGKTTRFSERVVRRLESVANLALLERPVRMLTLISAVRASLRARRRQYQVQRLLKSVEREVEQRDRFLAMLGHELRNPLAAIRAAIQVLNVAADRDPKILLDYRQIISRQTGVLTRLVDDLLDVTRISTGKIVLNRRPIDLRDVADRAVQTMKLAQATEHHQFVYERPGDPIVVDGDPVRLEQIISNILNNALRYTPPGGRIALTLDRESDQAVVRVSDTGYGIPADLLAKIFDPFVQVERNVVKAGGGLGLGLFVVTALVALHGGSVRASSDGPGKGSTFIVRLPIHRGAVQEAASARDIKPHSACRVLLIEDSPDSRLAMRQLLRMWGHDVAVAEDGPQGVIKATEYRPQVALVDIGLPGLDGYEVARRIRRDLGQTVRLVALTGYTQAEDRQRAREAGFDIHLSKPVDPDQLAELLSEFACS